MICLTALLSLTQSTSLWTPLTSPVDGTEPQPNPELDLAPLIDAFDFLQQHVLEIVRQNANLSSDLYQALMTMALIEEPEWITCFQDDLVKARRTPFTAPAAVASLRLAHQLHAMLDLAVPIAQQPQAAIQGAAVSAARFVVLALAQAPVAVRGAIENGVTFMHLLLSAPFIRDQDVVAGLRTLLPQTSVSALSHIDRDGRTPLYVALHSISWDENILHLLRSRMTGTSLIYTWSHSLSSSPYSTWITVFDAYNHAFLEGLQYDLDRVLAELPLVDPVLVARLRQSFMIRTLWRTPQAMQSLSIYVLIFHSHEADLLEQYDVSSEDQLLQLLFPASVTNGAQRAFLQMALRFVRDPNRPGLDHIIDELSLMGAPSPPTPLAIYFQELSNPHFNRSRAYSRMALSLCEHQLRHHRVPFPFPKVLPQIDFMMEIISRFMPEPQAFVALSLEQQLTQMISVSASLADGALSSNLIIVVAAVIFEIADDDVNVALAVLCRLVSQRFIFCDQRVHPFLHDAFCKVVLRLRACSAQFVDIFQRMVMILLNNQCVRDRIWSEMSSPLYPGPLSRIMHLLMESVEVDMLPMIYLQCPESPIHRALFPLDVEKFCLEVLQYRLDRALESQSKSGLRLANIQDLVENRHATCSVCMQDNVTADQQRQISARGRTPSVMTPCNHCFHTFCLKIWLLQHRNCPICRAAIDIPTYRCSMPDLAISELEIVAALSRLQL